MRLKRPKSLKKMPDWFPAYLLLFDMKQDFEQVHRIKSWTESPMPVQIQK